ncbi:MAG: flagellar FliJ family protein [Oscillospiraceae bacterium]|jgi:flagellar FliJ protein|nr:flagellar FliJ family protein [Oscillospiraceae bacterium]
MKKFVFSLESVLRYKKETLDMLKNEMAQLQMKIHELESNIFRIKQEYAGLNRTLVLEMQAGVEPGGIAVYKRYFANLDYQVHQLETQKFTVRRAASSKQKEIVRMKSDISGLEKLRDSQQKEYEAQGRKEQEQLIEEFVSRQNQSDRCMA